MNEILKDCKPFADKHRGNTWQTGPHWPTIIRFTPLFDEAVRLQDEIERLCKMLIVASEIIHKEAESYAIWGMDPPQSLLSFLDEVKAVTNGR